MNERPLPKIVQVDEITVVALGPEYRVIDQDSTLPLEEQLLEIANTATPPLLLVDVGETDFFSSSFLSTLFQSRNRLVRRNGRIGLCNLRPGCKKIIETTRVDKVFEVYDSREEAVRALGNNAPL